MKGNNPSNSHSKKRSEMSIQRTSRIRVLKSNKDDGQQWPREFKQWIRIFMFSFEIQNNIVVCWQNCFCLSLENRVYLQEFPR